MAKIMALITNAPYGGINYAGVDPVKPASGNVLLKPLYTGICGTDRAEAGGKLSFTFNPPGQDYLITGHEAVCRVIDAPENNYNIKNGDYVVPIVRRPGTCINCRIGRQDNCNDTGKDAQEAGIRGINGFAAEQFYDNVNNLIKIEDKSMLEVAAMTEPVKNVMKAFEVFNTAIKRSIYAGEESTYLLKNCLIIGTGSEAFLYAFMAREYRMNVYMANRHDIDENKYHVVDSINANFFDYTKEIPLKGIDLLIDTSGDPATVLKFMKMLNYNAVTILFGTNGKAPGASLDGEMIDYIIEHNITISGSVDGAKIHYLQAIEYLEKWNYTEGSTIKNLITGIYTPEQTDLFMKKPANEIKSLIKWF
ncbi:MAG: glucose 1-dehydrogenase [Ferroplasma sp.]